MPFGGCARQTFLHQPGANAFALPLEFKREYDCVLANPPFHGEGQASPDQVRARALMDQGSLGDWLQAGLKRTRSGGFSTAILRADRLNEALAALPLTGVTVDHSIEAIRARTAELMRRKVRPDGIVSGAGAATFALVAGIEDAGFRLGTDIDIVSKQASRLLHLLCPQIHVVNEDVRLAGSELARAVMARIAGKPVASLQSLSRPDAVEALDHEG